MCPGKLETAMRGRGAPHNFTGDFHVNVIDARYRGDEKNGTWQRHFSIIQS